MPDTINFLQSSKVRTHAKKKYLAFVRAARSRVAQLHKLPKILIVVAQPLEKIAQALACLVLLLPIAE